MKAFTIFSLATVVMLLVSTSLFSEEIDYRGCKIPVPFGWKKYELPSDFDICPMGNPLSPEGFIYNEYGTIWIGVSPMTDTDLAEWNTRLESETGKQRWILEERGEISGVPYFRASFIGPNPRLQSTLFIFPSLHTCVTALFSKVRGGYTPSEFVKWWTPPVADEWDQYLQTSKANIAQLVQSMKTNASLEKTSSTTASSP